MVTDGLVSVVVVNWNAGQYLQRCVDSLLAGSGPALREVVVVDNASTDGSVVRVSGPGVRLIRNDINRGLAAANNQGLRATTGDLVLFCNPDIVVRGDAVGAVAGCFARHPRAALVGGRLLTTGGELHTTVGELPRLRDAVAGRAVPGSFSWTRFPHDREIPVGYVVEAFYAVRRRATEKVGELDEGFFVYWEGVDWAARFRRAGWEIWFCPEAEATHAGGVTVAHHPYRAVVHAHRSMYRYFGKHSRVPRPLLAGLFAVRCVAKTLWTATGRSDSQKPRVRTR